ncbi:MAG: hypothetical protein WCV85_04150 [Patescibacteria group bacterium]|jgi:hypothetical protein
MSKLSTASALDKIYAAYVDELTAFPDILKAPPFQMEIAPMNPESLFSYPAAYESLRELSKQAGYAYAVPKRGQLTTFGKELANLLLTNMQENNIEQEEICQFIADDCFAGFVVLYLLGEARVQAKDFPTTAATLIDEAFQLSTFVATIERLGRAYHVYRVQMGDAVVEESTEPLTTIPCPNARDLKSHLSQPLSALFKTIKVNQPPK